MPRTLVYDVELAPNVVSTWGLYNQNVSISQIIEPSRIICYAWRWVGDSKAKAGFSAEWTDGYSDMIARLHELFDMADVVCGYNSIGFDDKHAKAAMLFEGLTPPSPFKQLDLYREVRRNFNMPSRKLDYVCQRLGLGAKVSHSGQALWNEVLRPSSEESGVKARKLMEKYCRGDVDLTVDLYNALYPWLSVPINAGLFVESDDEPVCPMCGKGVQRRGWAYTTHLRYRRYYCGGCPRWLKSRRSDRVAELRPA